MAHNLLNAETAIPRNMMAIRKLTMSWAFTVSNRPGVHRTIRFGESVLPLRGHARFAERGVPGPMTGDGVRYYAGGQYSDMSR
jgi:hypothetical protein